MTESGDKFLKVEIQEEWKSGDIVSIAVEDGNLCVEVFFKKDRKN